VGASVVDTQPRSAGKCARANCRCMQRCPDDMAPAVLAGRVFRVAAMGVAALIFGVAAFVVAEEQCDVNGGGALCTRSPPPIPIVPPIAGETADSELPDSGAASNSSPHGTLAAALTQELTKANQTDNVSSESEALKEIPEVGVGRLAFAMLMLLSILAWLFTMLKFAVDGSLPARLAIWGLLPEAYAAISVRAVFHLLRLKSGPTPVIVLRNCVTDEGALKLVEAMIDFGSKAGLEAIELPHNPQLGVAGLQAITDAALRPDSKVVELDFSYNPQLGDPALKILRPLLESKKSRIQVLRLADIGLTQAGLKGLAQATPKSQLRTLDLSWNSMKGAGEVVADIMDAPVLEELNLTCCDLSADDAGLISEQLQYTSIRAVQLGGNRFGSAGVVRFCEHLADSQVDEIGLEAVGLEVGCEGLSALAEAWVKRPFTRLKLHGNRMTNEEVATFVKTLKSMQQ